MKYIFYLFLLSCSAAYAQQPHECKLAEDNLVWRNKFENAKTLSEKLDLVKSKMINDSAYSVKDTFTTNYETVEKAKKDAKEGVSLPILCIFPKSIVNDQYGNECCPKIRFIFLGRQLYPIDINGDKELNDIVSTLSIKSIKEIRMLPPGNSLSGSEGSVFVYLSDKKKEKQMSRVLSKKKTTSP